MKKCRSSKWHLDLNPRPLEHESPPITTRPGLPPKTVDICMKKLSKAELKPETSGVGSNHSSNCAITLKYVNVSFFVIRFNFCVNVSIFVCFFVSFDVSFLPLNPAMKLLCQCLYFYLFLHSMYLVRHRIHRSTPFLFPLSCSEAAKAQNFFHIFVIGMHPT